ncbi:hypothetical protein ACFSUS_26025 [Spirosoma soli]|uniref:DUF481 domain-containing protein n=1 Tax=Spirosoma soli TaxID=1770529 RepID=A0ABW5MCA4_9BACT
MKQLLWVLVYLLPFGVVAQDEYYQKTNEPSPTKRVYTITLKDGTQLRGELIRQDSSEALIRTSNLGEIRLKSDQIVRMEQVGTHAEGEGFPNLFSQTMRIAPTAFSAEKGRVYFRNYFLYFSQFEYGINDNWSVGTTFFTFGPTNIFSVNTKVSFPLGDRVRLGVNGQYAAVRFDNFLFNKGLYANIGYLQGMVTTGDRQNNTTYGLGWSIANGDVSRSFIGTFGLVRKVSPKLTFISENFVLFGSGTATFAGIASAGVRFDRRRHAFDLAAYIPLIFERNSTALLTFTPFASYHLRIGK